MMVDEYKLKKIPLFDYPNCEYADYKDMHFKSFNQFLADGCLVIHAVNGHYYHKYDHTMDENGMGKFVAMLAGMLFMIEHGSMDEDIAYNVYCDIQDFETGEYDDLFTDADLVLIREDIAIIKEYLSKNPHLID